MSIFVLMVVIFILGYLAIALEHPLKIDKAPTALFMGSALWALYALNGPEILKLGHSLSWEHFLETNELEGLFEKFKQGVLAGHDLEHFYHSVTEFITHHEVLEHLADISTILFFLLGAMTIVEIVDQHEGFKIITDKIKTTNKVKLLWVLSFLTFFMSAVLDNLTTTIVIIALLRKLIGDQKTRWFYAAMVVVAANAGGAWSPIGDVTTIMLWIGGQVTTVNIILKLIFPSLITMVIPLVILTFMMKGNVERPQINDEEKEELTTPRQQMIMLIMGVSALLFVPVYKTFTHLPPYLGMVFGLSIIWITTEVMHKEKKHTIPNFKLTVTEILRRVDIPTIFFFLGILSAVAALQSAGHLDLLARTMKEAGLGVYAVSIIIGLLSAVVDNVPLVAASMGMYPIDPFHVQFMQDGIFWELIAYTAGTGGSILIVGSAAGVAAMGLEKIDFIWYMKKISLLALIGYFAGVGAYYLQEQFFEVKLETETISLNDLPSTSKEFLEKKYADYKVEEVELWKKHDKTVGYTINLKKGNEEIQAQFLPTGRFYDVKTMDEIHMEDKE